MKRIMLILAILVLSMNLYAQLQFPEWFELTAGLWARTNPAVAGVAPENGFWMARTAQLTNIRNDNERRLREALLQIRATNPDVFDQAFAAYGLELRVPTVR